MCLIHYLMWWMPIQYLFLTIISQVLPEFNLEKGDVFYELS